jgi:hypothetical protein
LEGVVSLESTGRRRRLAIVFGALTVAGAALTVPLTMNPWNLALGSWMATGTLAAALICGTCALVSLQRRPVLRLLVSAVGVAAAIGLVSVVVLVSAVFSPSVMSSRVSAVSPDGGIKLVVQTGGFSWGPDPGARVVLRSGRMPFHQENTVWRVQEGDPPSQVRFTGPRTIEIVAEGCAFRTGFDPGTLRVDRRHLAAFNRQGCDKP